MKLSAEQQDTMNFWLKEYPNLTEADLDPSKNQWNSVRLQGIKNTPNFRKIEPRYRFCKKCGTIVVDYIVFYESFTKDDTQISSTNIRSNDDNTNHNGYSWVQHLESMHPEAFNK